MINFNYDIHPHPPPTWVLTNSLTMCWKSPKIFQYIFVIYSPFSSKKCFFSFLSLLVEILKQNFDFCYGNALKCMFAERAQIEKKNQGVKIFSKTVIVIIMQNFYCTISYNFQPNVECRGRRNKFHSFMMLYN